MPIVRPFCITKYNHSVVGDLNLVVAPPYDVISSEKRQYYASKSPYNIVHLTLPEGQGDEKYENARKRILSFLLKDVLHTDREPGIFIYEQKFNFKGINVKRRGILCILKVEEYGNGVFRHEKTFGGPKEDRRKLMNAVNGHLESLFFLYNDKENNINNKIYDMEFDYTSQSVVDEDGVKHTLWKIPDKNLEKYILDILSNSKIYIADGHHRYETALNNAKEKNLTEKDPEAYVLGTFFNMYSKDVAILPTHRLIKTENFSRDSFLKEIGKYFKISVLPFFPNVRDIAISKLKTLLEERKTRNNTTAYGFYTMYDPEKIYLITMPDNVKQQVVNEMINKGIGKEVALLDVTILNELIFGKILGLTEEQLSSDVYLSFARSERDAIESTARGARDICFILNPVRIEEVIAVSEADLIMPQKSTDFYPKIQSGLSIYLFSEQSF